VRPLRTWGSVALGAVVAVGACTQIVGLDNDYTLGEPGSSTSTASGLAGGGQGPTSSSAGGNGGSTGGGGTATTSVSSTTGPGGGGTGGVPNCTGTHEYDAVVADCIDITVPNPDVCETNAGAGEMTITTAHFSLGTPHHGFVRFDLDTDVAQSQLMSITLELQVPNTMFADSIDSGNIWQVMPFDRPDLFIGQPVNVGNMPIANSMGPIVLGMTVDFALPTSIVDGGSVYLAIRPTQANAVDYMNTNGVTPPKLIVTCP
jgi:hypothetical protein